MTELTDPWDRYYSARHEQQMTAFLASPDANPHVWSRQPDCYRCGYCGATQPAEPGYPKNDTPCPRKGKDRL